MKYNDLELREEDVSNWQEVIGSLGLDKMVPAPEIVQIKYVHARGYSEQDYIEIQLLANENRNMANFLEESGYTREQISNICEGHEGDSL